MKDALGDVQSVLVLGGGSDIAIATCRKIVEQRHARVVLAARTPEALDTAAKELREVGASEVHTVPFDATVSIPYWGTTIELMEVLELARQGIIRAHVERFPLDRVGEAYQRLREGSLDGRAVIVPHG